MTYSQRYYRSHREQVLRYQRQKGAERYLRKLGIEATKPFLARLREKYERVFGMMLSTVGTSAHNEWIREERKLNRIEVVVLRRLLKKEGA